jgi:hypothetical protein
MQHSHQTAPNIMETNSGLVAGTTAPAAPTRPRRVILRLRQRGDRNLLDLDVRCLGHTLNHTDQVPPTHEKTSPTARTDATKRWEVQDESCTSHPGSVEETLFDQPKKMVPLIGTLASRV